MNKELIYKICKSCKINKPITDFNKVKNTKSGYRGSCKNCIYEQRKKYREKNKETINKYKRKWYNNNSEKIKGDISKYRVKHIDYYKEYSVKYYINNKDSLKKYNADYYNENKLKILDNLKTQYNKKKDIFKIKNKNYYLKNRNNLLEYKKKHSKTQIGKVTSINKYYKRKFNKRNSDITTKWLLNLKNNTTICECCNTELTYDKNKSNSYHLDHIIPLNIGGTHTMNNVRFICAKCNMTRPRDGSDLLKSKQSNL